MSAYSLIDICFKEYRNKVIEKLGKNIDNELK